MKSKPLVIYWAPVYNPESGASLFFDNPENVYLDLIKSKNPDSGNTSLFSCPAISERMKTSFVFKNTLKTKIAYDFSNPDSPRLDSIYGHKPIFTGKKSGFLGQANFAIDMRWIFFCEEPVTALINSPMLHQPTEFSKNAFFPIGKMNIGSWFRPITHEMQLWNDSGVLEIDEGDPLFYIELLTNRKVEMKRFKMDYELFGYMTASIQSLSFLPKGTSLEERYKRFISSKSDKLVISAIKRNLV